MNRRVGLKAGDTVGDKYAVERRLGEGGMGTVYLARHRLTGRQVALKWTPLDDDVTRERVLREARSMGRVAHPNVVGVLDAGQRGDAVYLVMDYLDGKTLRAHANARPLPPAEAIDLMLPALAGVAAAHQAGLLHRDLKPDNLFVCLDRDGTAFDVKVLDFGVAKEVRDGVAVSSLTHAGALVGTPKYMAPEQLTSGSKLDARADVYALGLILYELLTGRLPYDTADIRTMAVAILRGALVPIDVLRPDLPVELCAVVHTALATEPDGRHADVVALARALEPFAGTRRFEPPRPAHTPRDGQPVEDITSPEFAAISARTRRDPLPPRPSTTTPVRLGARAARKPVVWGAEPGVVFDGHDATTEDAVPPAAARDGGARSRVSVRAAILLAALAALAIAWLLAEPERRAAPLPRAERTDTVTANAPPAPPQAPPAPSAPPLPPAPATEVPAGAPPLQERASDPRPDAPLAPQPTVTRRRTAEAPAVPSRDVRTRGGTLRAEDF